MMTSKMGWAGLFAAMSFFAVACSGSDNAFGPLGNGSPSPKGSETEDDDAGAAAEADSGVAAKDAGRTDAARTDAGDDDEASIDAGWPDCATQPNGVAATSLADIWTADSKTPTNVWVPGVFVSAVSRGGCSAAQACQIYVQSAESYADLDGGSHQALKLFVSANAASHFAGIAVGDRVDVLAWAWRYDIGGQNELLLQVSASLPGCTHKIGSGNLVPVEVHLSKLTHTNYESIGPLLVKVKQVSGKASSSADETFGLYPSDFDGSFPDAGADIVSLSPFFLPGAAFSSSSVTASKVNAFDSVTGVFGIFTPSATTYLELYPRSAADIAK